MYNPAYLVNLFINSPLPQSNHAYERLLALREQAVDPLLEALSREERVLKKTEIVSLLSQIRGDKAFIGLFVEAQEIYQQFNFVSETNVMYLRELIDSLAVFHRPILTSFLSRCLHFPHSSIQLAAMTALEQLNEERTVYHLQPYLKERKWKIRRQAAESIYKITGERPLYRGYFIDQVATYLKKAWTRLQGADPTDPF